MTDPYTEPEPIDAPADALAAAVPGAPGWFRPATGSGAINLRIADAVQVAQFDDLTYQAVIPESGYVLALGPYATEEDAAAAADAALQLAYNDTGWPAVTPPE